MSVAESLETGGSREKMHSQNILDLVHNCGELQYAKGYHRQRSKASCR